MTKTVFSDDFKLIMRLISAIFDVYRLSISVSIWRSYDEFIFVKLSKSFLILFVYFWTINSFSVHWRSFVFELKAKVEKMLRIFNVRFIFIHMFVIIFDDSFIRPLFIHFCFLIASVFFISIWIFAVKLSYTFYVSNFVKQSRIRQWCFNKIINL